MLNPKIAQELQELRQKLDAEGKLLSQSQLDDYYQAFRQRFGPDRLRNLDGTDLLYTMHSGKEYDSMVYWLEYKSDTEFPGARFGSIANGNAYKFGMFRRSETGVWMSGSAQKPMEIREAEAVEKARKYRDQLIAACEALAQLSPDAGLDEYMRLQDLMIAVAPDVQDTIWGHKYFSLCYPDRVDSFHVIGYQNYHLLRMLLHPPAENKRYLATAQFAASAREVQMPLIDLCTVLVSRNGRPYNYWRIGTSDNTQARNQWPMMCENGVVAIGWPKLGDLTLEKHTDLKADVRAGLEQHYPNKTASTITRWTRQILTFVTGMQERDIVVASDGNTVLGVGRVKSGYIYNEAVKFAHQRAVDWLDLEEWHLPISSEGLLTTLRDLRFYDNQFAIEEKIYGKVPLLCIASGNAGADRISPIILPGLEGVPARIEAVLQRKGQVVLYGPPGTGKTYWAEKTAGELAARSEFNKTYESLTPEERAVVNGSAGTGDGLVRLCCFHPAYGYEDFLEGYRPRAHEGQMLFEMQDGIFKTLCRDAQQNPHRTYYLLVDEINRGDIPRIFGELLTILEKNKRGKMILLPLSKTPFAVPDNVCVIGTMNTADRSIALLDAALRRRFGFIELMPDSATLGQAILAGIPLAAWLDALNRRICEHVGRDARNLQIGHSYFLEEGRPLRDFSHFRRVLREDIVPLLEEYCYEDYTALEKILGTGLVDTSRQQIREELFAAGQQDELVQALLAPCPEITATAQAVMSEEATEDEVEDESGWEEEERTVDEGAL